jgi:hypothetical protein
MLSTLCLNVKFIYSLFLFKNYSITDFVGHFQVVTDENEQWDHINVTRHNPQVRSFKVANLDQPILLREHSEKECGIGAGCWLSSIAMLSFFIVKSYNI